VFSIFPFFASRCMFAHHFFFGAGEGWGLIQRILSYVQTFLNGSPCGPHPMVHVSLQADTYLLIFFKKKEWGGGRALLIFVDLNDCCLPLFRFICSGFPLPPPPPLVPVQILDPMEDTESGYEWLHRGDSRGMIPFKAFRWFR
jgi:hypothetical protein